MSYSILATYQFDKKIKQIAKKHRSIKEDLINLVSELSQNPIMGDELIENVFKIRMAISSKGKGKSGGSRVITYVKAADEIIYLIDIYDKSDQSTISIKKLKDLIENL
jgi:mRNA-degrading endonuclease RelE of RelBE toxin-antitoxin system